MTAHVCSKGWHTSNLDWTITCYCGAHICDVGQNSHSDREALHLIAAAPDLLAACEAVAATTWSRNTATIIGEQVRAAIAKAKGAT
jgi:hypothetical protein